MAHISYNQGTPFGNITANMIRHVQAAQQSAARIKTVMDEITAGGTVPSNLEAGTSHGQRQILGRT